MYTYQVQYVVYSKFLDYTSRAMCMTCKVASELMDNNPLNLIEFGGVILKLSDFVI
jgi:hypothetical protein